MKALQFLFYLGGILDLVFIYVIAANMIYPITCPADAPRSVEWSVVGAVAVMLAFMTVGFLLKSRDKLLLANLAIWLPAIPGLLFCGFASLFIIHDIFYK